MRSWWRGGTLHLVVERVQMLDLLLSRDYTMNDCSRKAGGAGKRKEADRSGVFVETEEPRGRWAESAQERRDTDIRIGTERRQGA